MFKNYFKIAVRNLKRNKAYTMINVLGLTLGTGCAILIFALVKYHLSFDTYHSNTERVYRITTEFHGEGIGYNTGVPSPLGEAFRNDYALAERVALVANFSNRLVSLPSPEGSRQFEEDIAFAEPAFFDILDFPLVQGSSQFALTEPNTAIITQRIAKKYFGDEDPTGRIMRIDDVLEVTVTGVLRDLPANTDRREEIYLPFANLEDHSPWLVEKDWWHSVNRGMQCFVLLKPGVSQVTLDQALSGISEKYYDKQNAKFFRFKSQHLDDIHFNPHLGGAVEKKHLWTSSLIGLFLVITACVNFINMATAQALGRSKEIGVRKSLGGQRGQLFWQFMTETAVITAAAMSFGLVLAYLALPHVNRLFNVQLGLSVFRDIHLLVFLPLVLVVMIFMSGSYPGFVLAGFKPVLALKGKLSQKDAGSFSLRRTLVVIQFTICQLLIIGTLVVADQMRYSMQADMGFEKDAIVMVPLPDNAASKISTLDAQLSGIAGVEQVTFCGEAPASEFTPSTGIRFDSRTEAEKFTISFKAGDHRYVPAFGLKIIAGRNLLPSDTIREFLINETVVRKLGLSDSREAVGKGAEINGRKGTVVGVVKDFHNQSFHQEIEPLYISTARENYFNCAIKVDLSSLEATLPEVEKAWSRVYPGKIYKYDFLDERIARFYELDRMILRLIRAFAAIAIIIGCLGLYGLVSFMAAHKTKEVGVRKVLGASVGNITWLFGKEFVRLLLVAFTIAAPLAWWIMTGWLENFVYRIQIGAAIFALAILITMTVAVLTVGYRSVKAALMNPVNSLRSD